MRRAITFYKFLDFVSNKNISDENGTKLRHYLKLHYILMVVVFYIAFATILLL